MVNVSEYSKLYNTNQAQTAGTATNTEPDDAVTFLPGYVYVGVAGNLVVDTVGGQTDVLFKNAPAGFVCPVKCVKIKETSTGTTTDDYVVIR